MQCASLQSAEATWLIRDATIRHHSRHSIQYTIYRICQMDIRLQQLSYSSRLTLHTCPRKYQLYKLSAVPRDDADPSQSVTFAYGHIVGLGIQELLQHNDIDRAMWAAFLMWEPDLLADNPKQVKSFWLGCSAIQKFHSLLNNGFMRGWVLYQHEGRPAIELSFIINFPDGYTYKGFVDAVLVQPDTGEVMVLECKTTAMNYVAAATYKNSAQATGYSIVLDVLFPKLSSYKVQYLIYKTKQGEFEAMDFEKDYLSRALWIREILLDIEMIKLYENAEIYPMHGESCNDFYRECEYMNICTLSTAALATDLTPEGTALIHKSNESNFQINLSLSDLIQAQLHREIEATI